MIRNRDRYILISAVIGSTGIAILDDGSLWIVYVGAESKARDVTKKP